MSFWQTWAATASCQILQDSIGSCNCPLPARRNSLREARGGGGDICIPLSQSFHGSVGLHDFLWGSLCLPEGMEETPSRSRRGEGGGRQSVPGSHRHSMRMVQLGHMPLGRALRALCGSCADLSCLIGFSDCAPAGGWLPAGFRPMQLHLHLPPPPAQQHIRQDSSLCHILHCTFVLYIRIQQPQHCSVAVILWWRSIVPVTDLVDPDPATDNLSGPIACMQSTRAAGFAEMGASDSDMLSHQPPSDK